MKKTCFLLLTLFVCSSCKNVLEEVAKKDTKQAVYYEAKLALNNRDYTGAINLLQSLGPDFLAQRDVSLVYASAYSGRCGLEFVNLVDSISNIGSSNLFLFLMQSFLGGTDQKITDCLASEAIMQSIGDQTVRVADENLLLGFSSLTKVGTVLSRYADQDADGTADAAFNHCSTTDFPDSAVREVGTGIANAIMSISAVATNISADALADIQSYCALDPSLNNLCTNTDPNAYSANEVRVLRQLLGSSDMGIGACTNFMDMACFCP